MMSEEERVSTQSEFIRRVRFQMEISRALDRALASPSRDARAQQVIVGTLIYCLNELDVAFANPQADFPAFDEKAFAAAQRHILLRQQDNGAP